LEVQIFESDSAGGQDYAGLGRVTNRISPSSAAHASHDRAGAGLDHAVVDPDRTTTTISTLILDPQMNRVRERRVNEESAS
jgi:hypothetical protein